MFWLQIVGSRKILHRLSPSVANPGGKRRVVKQPTRYGLRWPRNTGRVATHPDYSRIHTFALSSGFGEVFCRKSESALLNEIGRILDTLVELQWQAAQTDLREGK